MLENCFLRSGEADMKHRWLAVAAAMTLIAGAQAVPLQMVQAAQMRESITDQLLADALEGLEEGAYAEGEALVSIEAQQAVALTREGTFRFDANVRVESVNDFGLDEQTGKEIYIVHLTSDKYTTEELMELALTQFYVDGVCANQYLHVCGTDPYQDTQWYLDGSGTQSAGIRYSKQHVTDKDTPVITVIDTGVDYTHPDLADSMWINPYPGTLAGTYGYDFGDDDADPMDLNGHGTHVAGIAAAERGNGIGIAGVSKAKIMALKAASGAEEEMTEAAIVSAYEYVHDAQKAGVNIKAVNCSWGGTYDQNGVIQKAVNAVGELGALSVFAAGNDHVDWDAAGRARIVPFCLDSPYVVIVGASDEKDQAAYFSDYGATSVDLFAPGNNIFSTYTKVSYLPDIDDRKQMKSTKLYYNQCSDSWENLLPQGQTWKSYYTAQELGLKTNYSVSITPLQDGDGGYLRLGIKRNSFLPILGGEIAGSVYVDVTQLDLDPNGIYFVDYREGEEADGSITWREGSMISSPQDSRLVSSNGRMYMRIVGLSISPAMTGSELIWYLDDMKISVLDMDPVAFGAYTYSSGTSMAAPVVSAAVATLAAANPTLQAENLRSLLMKSVRKVDALDDKCKTGGIIDLSKLTTVATKVSLNKTSATLRYGKTLTLKAKVSPTYVTNAKVTWKSSNTKYATVSGKGVVKVKKAGIGHTVKITATAADGSGKKAVCKIKLKK